MPEMLPSGLPAALSGRDRQDPPADLSELGVLDAAAHLRRRDFSAAELLAAVQARIGQVNGGEPDFYGAPDAINAWVRLYPELAAEHARAADARLAAEGDEAPLLCGIPVGLKDLYAAGGLPLTASSRVLAGNVAAGDSVVWARLHAAGAVLAGHLHTHEFAYGGTCDQVGNPWRLDRTAGGSSGGSAAAVAARMVPAATGTDTCGSIRVPAALCGVSGIKPTTGLVPTDGIIALAPTFDTAGPLARSVADCSAVLSVMAGGGGQCVAHAAPAAPPGPLPLAPRPGRKPLSGCTVGISDRIASMELDADVAAAYEEAQHALTALGARLIHRPAPAPALDPASEEFAAVQAEAWSQHEPLAGRRDGYRPLVRRHVEAGRDALAAAAYIRVQQQRARHAAAWERWFTGHGITVLLEPTTRVVAYPRGDGLHYTEHNPLADLTFGWNVTGHPVVSLPAGLGRASGLPAGISLIARRGHDSDAVQAGIDLQERELPPLRLPG